MPVSQAERSKRYREKLRKQVVASRSVTALPTAVPTWLEPVLSDPILTGKVAEMIKQHTASGDPVITALKTCRDGWITDSDLIEVLKCLRSENEGEKIVLIARRYNKTL